jgi:uncharacterized cupin superfamily protein
MRFSRTNDRPAAIAIKLVYNEVLQPLIMKQINYHDVAWTEQKSPQQRYHVSRREITLALGGKKDTGTWGGGHPFDVEMTRVPPGAANWPYHLHSAQWEFYIIVSGAGELRAENHTGPVKAGDCLSIPPREPHQLRNTGAEDLVYFVIADNPPADITHYPDSNKWFIKPQRKFLTALEVSYYDGEE